jgi:hypothetical protein
VDVTCGSCSPTKRESLQHEQKDLGRRIDTLLDTFAIGSLKGPSVQAKLEALEARQREVAEQLADLLDEPVRLHPNLAVLYQRKIAALQDLLDNDATHTEAIEIIRSLVDQVIFRTDLFPSNTYSSAATSSAATFIFGATVQVLVHRACTASRNAFLIFNQLRNLTRGRSPPTPPRGIRRHGTRQSFFRWSLERA